MGFRMDTPITVAYNTIDEYAQRQREVLIRELLYCCEEITNHARSTYSYTDRTGNLTSSLGCLLVVDGKVVNETGFEVKLNGTEGVSTGKAYAHDIAAGFPIGIVLIAVAGMNYAAYVANKGYNVLQSAELLADKIVPEMLERLGLK